MTAGQSDQAGGTQRFAFLGVGSLANPYRVPTHNSRGARFEMLNSDRQTSDGTIEKVEYSASARAEDFVNVPALGDGRLAFVFTNDCRDTIDDSALTNCTMAQNSTGNLNAGGRYRITFLTRDNNDVMTRVQFHVRVGISSEGGNNITGGIGTRADPYQYTASNRAPGVLMLGVRNLNADRFSVSYRNSTNNGASFGGEISTGNPFPFFASALPCNDDGRDCPIVARSNAIFANNTYRVRVRIADGGRTSYVFFFLRVNP